MKSLKNHYYYNDINAFVLSNNTLRRLRRVENLYKADIQKKMVWGY